VVFLLDKFSEWLLAAHGISETRVEKELDQ
jgi:hypothetical protein